MIVCLNQLCNAFIMEELLLAIICLVLPKTGQMSISNFFHVCHLHVPLHHAWFGLVECPPRRHPLSQPSWQFWRVSRYADKAWSSGAVPSELLASSWRPMSSCVPAGLVYKNIICFQATGLLKCISYFTVHRHDCLLIPNWTWTRKGCK